MIPAKLASYVILFKEEKILMLRRYKTGFEDGNYTFPSGKVEENETFLECAKRELYEETNVNCNEFRFSHLLHRKKLNGEIWIDCFFVSEKWEGMPENKELNKCDDISWFPISKLPDNSIDFLKQVINKIQKNEKYSEFGF